MERKITHYVVKPEHQEHFTMLTAYALSINTLRLDDNRDRKKIQLLTEAKVLDLWCTPCYEKPRVKGWFNVYPADHMMIGPKETREEAIIDAGSGHKCIGQIFIDQEIE